MKKIATIGEYLVDMIPINNAYQPTPGGAPMNVAIAIQRLNGNVIPLAQVGKDFFGKMLKDELIDEGLDTSYIKTDANHKTTGQDLLYSGKAQSAPKSTSRIGVIVPFGFHLELDAVTARSSSVTEQPGGEFEAKIGFGPATA
ncbi:MAG: PfkB family carbohydrate kinase, partial [Acholeplasmataceae bacterium]